MKAVQFTKAYSIYNAGEVAGFPDAKAAELVSVGVAVAWTPPQSPSAHDEAEEAPASRPMTKEEELAALGVDTSTKDDDEETMKQKALRRPPKDKMVRSSQTK